MADRTEEQSADPAAATGTDDEQRRVVGCFDQRHGWTLFDHLLDDGHGRVLRPDLGQRLDNTAAASCCRAGRVTLTTSCRIDSVERSQGRFHACTAVRPVLRRAASAKANSTARCDVCEPSTPTTTSPPVFTSNGPPGTTTTGQEACCVSTIAVDPSRDAIAAPRPREPTTSRPADSASPCSAIAALSFK